MRIALKRTLSFFIALIMLFGMVPPSLSVNAEEGGGYGITLDPTAADLNGDGVINTADVVLIRRYIAGGYGIVLPQRAA
jgi:hypothetical protein